MYRMRQDRVVKGRLKEAGREYDDAHGADLVRQGFAETVRAKPPAKEVEDK